MIIFENAREGRDFFENPVPFFTPDGTANKKQTPALQRSLFFIEAEVLGREPAVCRGEKGGKARLRRREEESSSRQEADSLHLDIGPPGNHPEILLEV